MYLSKEPLQRVIMITTTNNCQIIEDEETIAYIGELPNPQNLKPTYGIAVQDKYIHNIFGKLKKSPSRLMHDFEKRSYQP